MAAVENGRSSNIRNVRPPIVIPAPPMWDKFLSSFPEDDQVPEKDVQDIESLKKVVRNMLLAETSSKKVIVLVDAIERLALAYHFETEIEEKLGEVYNTSGEEDDDLFTAALRFRLLRQHQHHVSCDVFDVFVGEDGKLKEGLSSDAEGLLSLYEAAHVRFHDEEILDEAVVFATHHLSRMLPDLGSSPLKDKVQSALTNSLHRSMLILNFPSQVSIYERENSKDDLLLKLAKLNFKVLQNMYRKEISQLLRWWNIFELKTKLPYARDRMVECYIWGAAIHFEPKYSFVRTEAARNMQMVSIMDDTYDNYATLEEAQLFTQILDKWNLEEIDPLPEYMKVVYRFIMSVHDDLQLEAAKQGKLFAIPPYRETVKQLSRAYNQEQIWIMERRMPSFEEYMTNSVITSCIYVMLGSIIPGINSATKENVDWLLSEPKVLISTARMGRHLQDLASHQREYREGQLLTVVDCYMKNYGVSKQEALSEFAKLVENGWKDINEEWVDGTSVLCKEMIGQLMNYGRIAEVTYKNAEDHYTYPEKFLGPLIAALFLDPLL